MNALDNYFLGFFSTLFIFFIVARFASTRFTIENAKNPYRYSQKNIHHLVSPYIGGIKKPNKKTQSINHFNKTNLKVIIVDGEAFWVKDNTLYTAKMTQDGVDKETTSVVDTMSMDKVQLDKMLFIIDQLRDGDNNDSRGPRY
jgi:hypothetical protein